MFACVFQHAFLFTLFLTNGMMIGRADADFCSTHHAEMLRRQLEEFSAELPFTVEDGTKHTPYITYSEDGQKATVTVGNGDEEGGVFHPTVPSDDPEVVHYVTHIWVLDEDGAVVGLDATDPSTATVPVTYSFDVPKGATSLTAYEFCNKHGLWEGPQADVPTTAVSAETIAPTCTADQLEEAAWISTHADYLRRQEKFFESGPFTVDDGTKHTPYITLSEDNLTGTVVVGNGDVEGGVFHPMNPSINGSEPHWITDIYVVDQNNNIIAMNSLDPTEADKATLTFNIGPNVTETKAYEWCNLHGLWEGPSVQVGSVDAPESAAAATALAGFVVAVVLSVSFFL